MSMNINVSVDELIRFADYVSDFGKYIDGDCQELRMSVSKLAATMDEESVATIISTVNQITRIVENKNSELTNLEHRVRDYDYFVNELKKAANN